MLGGRVKTLHPRDPRRHPRPPRPRGRRATLAEHGIEPFDLVCVNLYPFASVAARLGPTEDETIEMIDVGGPSMLRAAAKNFAHVAAVSDPRQYEVVLRELREHGEVSLDTRRKLAARGVRDDGRLRGRDRDAGSRASERFPEQLTLSFRKVSDLPYGENPHQARGALLGGRRAQAPALARRAARRARSSRTTTSPTSRARAASRASSSEPAVVIVKHANPCGVAVGDDDRGGVGARARRRPGVGVRLRRDPQPPGHGDARRADRRALRRGAVRARVRRRRGRGALARSRRCGSCSDGERRTDTPGERDFKRVLGGLLVQDRDTEPEEREAMEVVTRRRSRGRSGTTCCSRGASASTCRRTRSCSRATLQTIGVGAGQMSRVDAVRIALEKARELGHDPQGAVLASDAFFPFADGPQLALDAGIAAIVQPGGSKRDDEVKAAVGPAGAAMVYTGRRHFRH